jgi:hypothetical protein
MINFATMSIKSDIPQIAALRNSVEKACGRPLATHSDFVFLVGEIERALKQHVSESTLERVWGYSTRGYETVSLRTLNVLAQYAKGVGWESFCELLRVDCGVESEMFNAVALSSSELEVGDKVRIGWLPDRTCEVRYLGANRFVAEVCANSKMQPGDTFECLEFCLGKPLVMSNFIVNGEALAQTYVAGQRNGLTMLQMVD